MAKKVTRKKRERTTRECHRKYKREAEKYEQQWTILIGGFFEAILQIDWDNGSPYVNPNAENLVRKEDYNIFGDFNREWVRFCNFWNNDPKRRILAEVDRFHKFAIDNTQVHDEPKEYTFKDVKS